MKRFYPSLCIHLGILACFIALPLTIVCVPSFATDRLQVTLKENVVINKDDVLLGDIADISGELKFGALSIERAEVATSPLPGKTRFLSLDYVRIRLRQAGFKTDTMTFGGAQDVQINREAACFPTNALVKAVESEIRIRMPWKRENVTIGDIRIYDNIRLPTGGLFHRIVPKPDEDYLGQTILGIYLYVDGELVAKTHAQTNISVMADVVRVIRPLGKHQRIRPEDLSVVRADLSRLSPETVRRVEDVLGNRTTQAIYPNTYLKQGMYRPPPIVKRGDIVKIIANTGSMTITATGKVKQKGCKGDMVHVINTDSSRVIIARVIGPGAVEVEF